MSALREKQSEFARHLAKLILWIDEQGWDVTLSDVGVARQRRVVANGEQVIALDREHMANSLHYLRLAADLNLFIGGQWITAGTDPAWQAIGAAWESMGPLCRWGGRFEKPDANHVSLEYEGVA